MKAIALRIFHDKKANANRTPGEVFEVTAARLEAINSTVFGKLAEKVEEKPKKAGDKEEKPEKEG